VLRDLGLDAAEVEAYLARHLGDVQAALGRRPKAGAG
jgi:hypothetical protein